MYWEDKRIPGAGILMQNVCVKANFMRLVSFFFFFCEKYSQLCRSMMLSVCPEFPIKASIITFLTSSCSWQCELL